MWVPRYLLVEGVAASMRVFVGFNYRSLKSGWKVVGGRLQIVRDGLAEVQQGRIFSTGRLSEQQVGLLTSDQLDRPVS